MKKINIAELLKDCPKGMELDSPVYYNLTFDYINEEQGRIYCKAENRDTTWFTIYGCASKSPSAKCVIFPKGKTTWEGFVPPCEFKDGDILYCDANDYGENDDDFKYIFIFDKLEDGKYYYPHCHLGGSEFYDDKTYLVEDYPIRFATEEEKQKLFQAIKDNGYTWNANTKSLEELDDPKFKDGDVISNSLDTCIFKGEGRIKGTVDYYCGVHTDYFIVKDNKSNPNGHYGNIVDYRLATEEEKQTFFDVLKKNGYKWNAETKTLEKLIKPRFKIGNKIKLKNSPSNIISTVTKINNDGSICVNDYTWVIKYELQDKYELVLDKFDITTLKPFDKVLVRDSDKDMWCASIFSHTCKDKYFCVGTWHNQCIPYEANKELLGTTNDCDKFYKTWE